MAYATILDYRFENKLPSKSPKVFFYIWGIIERKISENGCIMLLVAIYKSSVSQFFGNPICQISLFAFRLCARQAV